MMKMLKRLLRDRKGVSLTEVVVAMTVVVIVTGTAISVIAASAKADARYRDKFTALNGCENAVECARFAYNDEETLRKALAKAGLAPEEVGDPDTDYVLVCGKETVRVDLSDDNDENSVVIYYNDEIIYEK